MSCRKLCKTRENPSTGRCVNFDGKIGKHIVGRPKLCDTVENTSTKRCVLKRRCTPHAKLTTINDRRRIAKKTHGGRKAKNPTNERTKIAKTSRARTKKSESAKPKILPLCLPKKFEDLAVKCACNKTWVTYSKLGSGMYGTVYRACKSGVCEYAIKKQKYNAEAKAEIQAYLSLDKLNVAPKLFAAWVCKGELYIVLEKMVKCKHQPGQLKLRVRKLLDKLEKHGWLHVDIHRGNVMCTKKGRTVLVDFGWAVEKGKTSYANHEGKTYAMLKEIQERIFLDSFA